MSILPRASAPVASPPAAPACPAQLLGPHHRQEIALQALAGTRPVTHLAQAYRVRRQWNLPHSRWGAPPRFPTRPHPAAVEGEIVHAVLDRLFKALAVRGMPALKTASFREGL